MLAQVPLTLPYVLLRSTNLVLCRIFCGLYWRWKYRHAYLYIPLEIQTETLTVRICKYGPHLQLPPHLTPPRIGPHPEILSWLNMHTQNFSSSKKGISILQTFAEYFYLNHDVSETDFCLRLQMKPTQMGPMETTSVCLCLCGPETEANSFYWARLNWFYLKTETESGLRNVEFLNKRQDDG
jgi:hypothetical protein